MVFTLIQDASKILSNGTHLAWISDDQAYVEEQFILYTTEDDTMPMFERMSLPLGVVTATLADLPSGEPYLFQIVQMFGSTVVHSNTIKITPSKKPSAPQMISVTSLDNALLLRVTLGNDNAADLNVIVFTFSNKTDIFSIKKDIVGGTPVSMTIDYLLTNIDNPLLTNYSVFEMACYTSNDRGTCAFSNALVGECSDFPNAAISPTAVPIPSQRTVIFSWANPSDFDTYKNSSTVLTANVYYKLKSAFWENVGSTHLFR